MSIRHTSLHWLLLLATDSLTPLPGWPPMIIGSPGRRFRLQYVSHWHCITAFWNTGHAWVNVTSLRHNTAVNRRVTSLAA